MDPNVALLDSVTDLCHLCISANVLYNTLLKRGWCPGVFLSIQRLWRASAGDSTLRIMPIVCNPLYYEKVNSSFLFSFFFLFFFGLGSFLLF